MTVEEIFEIGVRYGKLIRTLEDTEGQVVALQASRHRYKRVAQVLFAKAYPDRTSIMITKALLEAELTENFIVIDDKKGITLEVRKKNAKETD